MQTNILSKWYDSKQIKQETLRVVTIAMICSTLASENFNIFRSLYI